MLLLSKSIFLKFINQKLSLTFHHTPKLLFVLTRENIFILVFNIYEYQLMKLAKSTVDNQFQHNV